MWRKIGVYLFTFFILSSASLSPVFAQKNYGLNEVASKANYQVGQNNSVWVMVFKTINFLLIVLGFVFFGFMLYAGLRWMTARGNEEYVGRAKGAIESSIYGIVIIMLAYALTTFIMRAAQLNK